MTLEKLLNKLKDRAIRRYVFKVTPLAKPRMTKSDSWKKRPVVMNYWAFKNDLNTVAEKTTFLLTDHVVLSFIIPMPKSWSDKKKEAMAGQRHQQTPDTDNLIKAFKDALLDDDKMVYIDIASKHWGKVGDTKGKIIAYEYDN